MAMEEKQLHNEAMEDGGGQRAARAAQGRVLTFFLFLAGLNPTFNPTLYNPTINRGNFGNFWPLFLL